jgi:hypothetical protein
LSSWRQLASGIISDDLVVLCAPRECRRRDRQCDGDENAGVRKESIKANPRAGASGERYTVPPLHSTKFSLAHLSSDVKAGVSILT